MPLKKKALLAIRGFGLFVLLLILGIPGWVGCLSFLLLKDLRWVYLISLAVALLWFYASWAGDGIDVGAVHFRPHDSFQLGDGLSPIANLIKLLLFAIFGIKVGYALREGYRTARGGRQGEVR